MPCFYPLRAFKTAGGDVVFNELNRYDIVSQLSLPCGQCTGCRLERSRQWAIRCLHEASLWPHSIFVTLTYDDQALPSTGSLRYVDYQLFMKRLRKHFEPSRIRFYMCGEYGDETYRPHYHALLFNCFFHDRKHLKTTPAGFHIYTSNALAQLWPFGLSSIGDVTFESAAYVARYCMQKQTGPDSKYFYRRYSSEVDTINFDMETGEIYSHELVPEFNMMSLKPGIGTGFFHKWKRDIYPHDYCIINGKEVKPPKFYDKLYQEENPLQADYTFFLREQNGRARYQDNTPERLAVKEIVAKAGLNQFHRS